MAFEDSGKQRRLSRLFRHSDGRPVILPIDDGLISGPGARLSVLALVAVDRSPSPPRSWAKTAGSPQVHLSDARDRRDGLRQARV